MQVVRIVYKTTPRHLWPAAAVNVNQQLMKLKKEGEIVDGEDGTETKWKPVAVQNNKL